MRPGCRACGGGVGGQPRHVRVGHGCFPSPSPFVDALFVDVSPFLGGVDVLVNVVGNQAARGYTWTRILVSMRWRQTLVSNVKLDVLLHPQGCARDALKETRCDRGFLPSASTRTALPRRSPYVTSKAAVEGLTRTLARELGPDGITVNTILPGMIDNARLDFILSRIAKDEGRSKAEVEREMLGFVCRTGG